MDKSRYDELHDHYYEILSSKKGTRYERLAAVVFRTLHEEGAVIHDFKLRGESDVEHQIDVLLDVGGQRKRVLIECKDFDKSGENVGLGILRDFRSVVEDTKPDEAFVITCTGFTQPARQFAKAKGIKLAVLRLLEDRDWEGRIKTVCIRLHVQPPPTLEPLHLRLAPDVATAIHAEAVAEGIQFPRVNKGEPVYLVSQFEEIPFIEYLDREAARASPLQGSEFVSVDPVIWKLKIGNNAPRPFEEFAFKFKFWPIQTRDIVVDPVAELILKGFRDDDIIIFAKQLGRAKIDSEGNILYEPI